MQKPDPPAAIEYTREAKERVDTHGDIVTPLDEAALRDTLHELVGQGIEALTIALINSYTNQTTKSASKPLPRSCFPSCRSPPRPRCCPSSASTSGR